MPKSGLHQVSVLLGLSLFLTGFAAAAVAPYRAIVAIDGLGLSNATYAWIMTVSALATAAASVAMGSISDRVGDRRRLVIFSAALGSLAYGLIYLFPTPVVYIIAFCVILPFGGALFSLSFSFSRAFYDRNRPEQAEFMTSVLRTVFSAAWVVVPPVAGYIASAWTVFDVFAIAALAYIGCIAIFVLLLRRPDAAIPLPPRPDAGGTRAFWRVLPAGRLIGIGGVVLVRIALMLHLTTLPLALVRDFGASLTDVGFTAAFAAGLEVPLMLGWGIVAARWPKERMLILNAAIYGLYMLLIVVARSANDVLWLQILNAIATAALLSITISYMQDTIKGRLGLSTSLLDVVTVVASLAAAAVFGLFSTETGYLLVFLVGAALSFAGAGLIALSTTPRWRAE
jgi:MFS family permease